MWPYITALIFLLFLLGILVYFIRLDATKSARLSALKKEIKERNRAQKIVDTVRNTPIDRVRDKLQQTK